MTDAKKRLRIAVLNRVFSPVGGGAERYSIALVEQLAARHELHVFAQQIDHHWPGVTYHTVSRPLTRPRWLNQLWYATATWWFTRRGFDLVHSHENVWCCQVQTLHVLPLKYTLFHGRRGWCLALRWLKVATSLRLLSYLALERSCFSNPARSRLVVTSSSLLDKVASVYPGAAASLRLVTPGIDQLHVVTTPEQRGALRRKLQLPESGNAILFVGNDYRKKGLATLIKALAALPQDSWLAVVGNRGQIAHFRSQAKAAGVQQRVFFLGPLKDINEAYMAADCLAHPTLEDTFAMVVLEAMAHGLPVVVSSAEYCGIAGLLSDKINALVLPEPRDVNALANALRQIILIGPLRLELSAAALEFASRHLWSAVARQQEEVYFSTLTAPGA